MLVIAWHFGAATMCEFSRAEFARGMRALRCDSPEKLRRRLPELRRELQDERKFKVCAPWTDTLLCAKASADSPWQHALQHLYTAWWNSSLFVVAVGKGSGKHCAKLWLYCPVCVCCLGNTISVTLSASQVATTSALAGEGGQMLRCCSSHTSVGVQCRKSTSLRMALAWRRA